MGRIFIEGSVGVGKTFLAQTLSRLYKMEHIESNQLLGLVGNRVTENPIYDWSIPGEIITYEWMKKKNISISEPTGFTPQEDDIIILLVDDSDNLEYKRKMRGRPYEFAPHITDEDLREYDEFFYRRFREYCKEHNIQYIEFHCRKLV